jgi:diaminopimelate epimerase
VTNWQTELSFAIAMPRWSFTKWHGLENDFVVVDERASAPLPIDAVPTLCHRHRGIGADGVLVISRPDLPGADVRMRVYNADGSEAEMCGNGIRCVARQLRGDGALAVQTGAGILHCLVLPGGEVEVEMGIARIDPAPDGEIAAGGHTLHATRVRMGNPHLVTFDDVEPSARGGIGAALQQVVQGGTNVEFARLVEGGLRLDVWERGVGFTRACGTGACAAVAAGCVTGRIPYDEAIRVTLPGGDLTVVVPRGEHPVLMRGPAVKVFEGALELR